MGELGEFVWDGLQARDKQFWLNPSANGLHILTGEDSVFCPDSTGAGNYSILSSVRDWLGAINASSPLVPPANFWLELSYTDRTICRLSVTGIYVDGIDRHSCG
jgi:hypothetical protein